MSPEQHDGKPGDALSDQFSFAVSLYESLHGRRPFAGRSASENRRRDPQRSARPRRRRYSARDRSRAVDGAGTRSGPAARVDGRSAAALERAGAKRPAVAWLAGAAVLLTVGAAGARLWTHHGTTANNPPPIQTAIPSTAASKTAPPATPLTAAVDGRGKARRQRAQRRMDHRRRPVSSGRARKRGARAARARTVATLRTPGRRAMQAQLLARAEREMRSARRRGLSRRALGEVVGDWSEEVAARAQETRQLSAARRPLHRRKEAARTGVPEQPVVPPNRRKACSPPRWRACCPAASFPTVEKRVMAVALQANVASSDAAGQSGWCGALQRTLIADTRSGGGRRLLCPARGHPVGHKVLLPPALESRRGLPLPHRVLSPRQELPRGRAPGRDAQPGRNARDRGRRRARQSLVPPQPGRRGLPGVHGGRRGG